MTKSESKEAKYKRWLQELGVYTEACDPIVGALCTLERELSRTRKAWKATAPKGSAPLTTDPLYQEIRKQRMDILKYQTELCLTPNQIQKIRRQANPGAANDPPPTSGNPEFAKLLDGIREMTHGSAP